jgi:hypothetical protein
VNTDINNQEINELYQEYWAIHAKMIDKDHNPLEIAAILMAQSLSMYKTILDADDYNQMVDSISDLRDKVQELTPDQQYYQ